MILRLITPVYPSLCRAYCVLPTARETFSTWMSFPLNAEHQKSNPPHLPTSLLHLGPHCHQNSCASQEPENHFWLRSPAHSIEIQCSVNIKKKKKSQGPVHSILTTFTHLGHYYLSPRLPQSLLTRPWLQSYPKMQIWYYFPNLKLPMAPSDLRMKSEHFSRSILCFTSLDHFLAFSSQLPCPRFTSLAGPNSYFLQGNGPSVG